MRNGRHDDRDHLRHEQRIEVAAPGRSEAVGAVERLHSLDIATLLARRLPLLVVTEHFRDPVGPPGERLGQTGSVMRMPLTASPTSGSPRQPRRPDLEPRKGACSEAEGSAMRYGGALLRIVR